MRFVQQKYRTLYTSFEVLKILKQVSSVKFAVGRYLLYSIPLGRAKKLYSELTLAVCLKASLTLTSSESFVSRFFISLFSVLLFSSISVSFSGISFEFGSTSLLLATFCQFSLKGPSALSNILP